MNTSAFSSSQISESKGFSCVTVKNIHFGWQWFPNKCDYCVSIQGGRPPPFWAVSEYTPFSLCLRHRASLIVIFLVTMKLYLAVKNNIKNLENVQIDALELLVLLYYYLYYCITNCITVLLLVNTYSLTQPLVDH